MSYIPASIFDRCGAQRRTSKSKISKNYTKLFLSWCSQRFVFFRSVGKIYLFGFEIEDVEELKTKPETSGRDLAVGMDEAWYGTQI